MKKKITSLLVLTVAVAGGVIVYEQMLFKRLAAQLQEQTDTIAEAYLSLSTTHLLPLEERYELAQDQREAIERVESQMANLEAAATLETKLQHISLLQVGLVDFIETATVEQPLVKDASFVHLQKEMGETGAIRENLSLYNTLALRWNRALQSEVGSVAARMGGTSENILPYLRFDGEQEFVTIVEL